MQAAGCWEVGIVFQFHCVSISSCFNIIVFRYHRVSISSSNNLVNHFPSQLSQPLVSTEMWIGEEILVKPQLVQDRRVYVAKVIWAFDRTKSNRVG